jgi:protoporphyrinogen oxidase
MRQGVGPALYNAFYLPYARKIWGLEPEAISSVQATRRVAARSPLSLLRKATAALPIIGNRASAAFYYPRGGYGQISQRLAEASQAAGARMMLGSRIETIDLSADDRVSLRVTCGERIVDVECDQVWSTIPISALVDRLTPTPPEPVRQAANALTSRAMVLVYLTLETSQFTGFDTHYFPEQNVPFSRVSEPKHFSGDGPPDRTVLCAEIPTSVDSDLWRMTQADATELVASALADVGLPITAPISDTLVVRLPNAYPIYPVGFESSFDTADAWLRGQERLVSFGRQGLFAHNNLHHVLDMAYAAVDCLDVNGRFDRQRWGDFRTEFDHQVVVD